MTHPLPLSYLNRFLGSVADCLDAFTAALFVFEHETKRLKLRAFHSLSDAVIPDVVIEEGQGFLSWVMRHQRPLQVPRFNRDSRSLGFYDRDAGLKSFLAVPLPDKAGVLCVDSKARFAFSAKHEKILEALAVTAYELLSAETSRGLLGFYASLLRWQMSCYESHEAAVIDLLQILSLDTAIVARHLVGTSFVVVEDVLGVDPGCPTPGLFRGEKIRLGQGITGWVAKHRSSILLDKRKNYAGKSFLLRPGEPFVFGPVVVGVFCPSMAEVLGINYCFVFSGDGDTSCWPSDFLRIMEFVLKGLTPWH